MAQEARRPLFMLRSADEAIGAHQRAVYEAYGHFKAQAARLLDAIGIRPRREGSCRHDSPSGPRRRMNITIR
jgi:hypothetical protein